MEVFLNYLKAELPSVCLIGIRGGMFIRFIYDCVIIMIYQISRDQETSSECSQCKQEHEEGESHVHHHEETSSQEENIEIESHSKPLKPQKRGDTSSIILVLQDQIKQLQRHNQDKDRMIRELKYQLDSRSKKAHLETILSRNSNSVQKFQKESIMSPKGMIHRVFSPELKPKTKAYIQHDSALQIALLQKQIKQFQLKVMQLTTKLKEYEDSFSWMQKFIISFVHMAEDLSFTYGSKVQLKGLTLRKKTKICWKYIKELINYLIK